MKIEKQNKNVSEKLSELLNSKSDNIYVNNPCKVIAVNGNYVDVLPIIDDEEDNQPLYDVPIQREETQSAYIFLGIKEGDRGTLKYFDRSIDSYKIDGFDDYSEDDRSHDGNDAVFKLGFVPDTEAFIYPVDKEIEIGLKDKSAKISFEHGQITIIADNINTKGTLNHEGNINVNGSIVATQEITVKGIALSLHTHTDSQGGDTSSPK